jgi:AcrR family transcriptional regulator
VAKKKPVQAGLPARRDRRRQEPTALYRERRKVILDAAAATFRESGYELTNIGDIGKRAGVDRASVYYYFSTKEEILIELISGPMIRNTGAMAEIVASDLSPPKKLTQAVDDLMEAFDETFPVLSIYFEERFDRVLETSNLPEHAELAEAQSRYFQLWTELLEQGSASGDFALEGAPAVHAFIIIGILRYTSRWYRTGGAQTAREIGAVYTHTILRGLQPRGGRRRQVSAAMPR